MKLTQEQSNWIKYYECETGFDLLWIDMLESGEETFEKFAQRNVDWWESHTSDVLNRISHFPKSDEYYNSL